ncbi:MBL fold metallo-hydrolase [Lentisphaerota bacterium WC36G]|nr:MBL fold metallo-hydrolase [Lentisphaerae bacterium WC36]
MKQERIIVGLLEVNCYLIFSDKSKILYIIDPGNDANIIAEATKKYPFEKAIVLLTHAHFDHISGLGELNELLNIEEFFLCEDDEQLYSSPNNQMLPYFPRATNLPKTCNQFSKLSKLNNNVDKIEIIRTPGHTRGGCCYYFVDVNTLFSGDTLFANSTGRTDLPGGDFAQLVNSIKSKLFKLPDNIVVKPGHGPSSSIGNEKKYNQSLAGF